MLRDDELGVPAGLIETEHVPFLAEVRALAPALSAPAAWLSEVDDDAVADVRRVHVAADLRNPTDDLVARDDRRAVARFHPVEEVQVRMTYARGEDLEQDVLRSRLRIRDLHELYGSARLEPDRTHASPKVGPAQNGLADSEESMSGFVPAAAGPKCT